MQNFEFLKSIIKNLSHVEMRTLEEVLDSLNGKNAEITKKYKKLFAVIVENFEVSYFEVEKIIFGKSMSNVMKKIITGLIDKILDVLLLNNSIVENEFYDTRAKEIFGIRKSMLQFDMLLTRGSNMFNLNVLEKIITKSKYYEYYDILLFALYKKRNLIGIRDGERKYLSISTEIEYFEDCRISLYRAYEYYMSLWKYAFSSSYENKIKKQLPDMINEVKHDYIRTKSKTIKFYLFYLEYSFYSLKKDYLSKTKTLLNLCNYLKNNREISSKYKLGTAYLNLSDCYIEQFKFNDAITNLNTSFRLLNNSEINRSIVDELKLLSFFYLGNVEKLYSVLLAMENNIKQENKFPRLFIARWKFYIASIYFAQLKFKISLSVLSRIDEFENDKERWNIAIRIMLIMNHIELENFDIAEKQVDNIRKYIDRIKIQNVIPKRSELIVSVLIALTRNSFNFNSIENKKKKELLILSSTQPDYRWQIKSPEMIPFHEWFLAKKNNQPYNHGEVMEKMKKQHGPKQ